MTRTYSQVQTILPLLKRGVGIHHGGLLPILKEIIEILFQVSTARTWERTSERISYCTAMLFDMFISWFYFYCFSLLNIRLHDIRYTFYDINGLNWFKSKCSILEMFFNVNWQKRVYPFRYFNPYLYHYVNLCLHLYLIHHLHLRIFIFMIFSIFILIFKFIFLFVFTFKFVFIFICIIRRVW